MNHDTDDDTDDSKARKFSYALALTLGLAVVTMGLYSSFDNLSTYASTHGFPAGAVLPIGLDLGIPALLILDWLRPQPFLRGAAWALVAFTAFANAAVAGGTPKDRVLHAALPTIGSLIIEAGRRLQNDTSRMDKIRISRWLLSPVRTVRLWRRMVLWEVTSYSEALTRESAILHARTVLMALHDQRKWRKTRDLVPPTLIHQISTGQLPSTVLYGSDLQEAVQDWVLSTLRDLAERPALVLPGTVPAEADRIADREPAPEDPWVLISVGQDRIRPDDTPEEMFAVAVALSWRHFLQVGKHIPYEDLRAALKTGSPRAAAIGKAIRSAYENPSVITDPTPDPEPAEDPTGQAPAEEAPVGPGETRLITAPAPIHADA